jgi:hypothetical protein
MRKIHTIGLALVAVFAFFAIAATSAFALSEWLVDGASVPSTAKVHVETTGTVVLADLGAGVTVECAGGGLGMVWEGQGTIEEAEATSCTTLAGSCGGPSAKAVNTPWNVEILLLEPADEHYLLMLKNGGKGAPGWEVTCFSIFKDACTTEAGEPLTENMPLESDVLAIFDQGSLATCTLGGSGQGEVAGETLLVALEGLSLEIS